MSKRAIKTISIFLSFCLFVSFFAYAKVYNDNDANYFKFITGYNDGTFRPDNFLTRAECAKMLSFVLVFENDDDNEMFFSDLNSSHWAHNAVTELSKEDILTGYADGSFKPDEFITRAEFAAVIARALDLEGDKGKDFSDINGHWASGYIYSLYNKKIVGGYPDNSYKPNDFITRAEGVAIINRATGNKIDHTVDKTAFYDLKSSHWAYFDIMAAASDTCLESTLKHTNFDFNDITYIELDPVSLKAELESLLIEFKTADGTRQGEIYNRIVTIETDVTRAIAMSGINVKRNVMSKKDQNNTNNAYVCGNIIREAKKMQYNMLSDVCDKAEFEAVIGIAIEDIPLPQISLPEKLVDLFTEEQEYENEFNEFMYGNSIVYNGSQYSLAQAEHSDDPKLANIALNHYVEYEKEYGEIFSNLIDVRNRIANYFGYRYYTDFGYLMSGKTYSTKDVERIREEVKTYIAPLFYKLSLARNGYENGYYSVGNFSIEEKGSYVEDSKAFLTQLSPQTREALNFLQTSNLMDIEMRQNKAQVAFTSYIDEFNSPFLFINATGNYTDYQDFAHEFGHAFHAYRIGKSGISASSDICEVASYGMEMLLIHSYKSFFNDNFKDVIYTDFYEKLSLILTTTFMDEFQCIAYSDPFLSIQERNAIYAKLRNEYFIGSNYSHEAHKRGICWTNPTHIFTVPYYSIDYTLALTVAFQLWEIGNNEGFDAEFEKYMDILETPFIDYNISYVAVGAGLLSPFKKGVIKSLSEKLDEYFKIE